MPHFTDPRDETPTGQPPPPPPPVDPFEGLNTQITEDIDLFRRNLGTSNIQFRDIGEQLIQRGLGTATDPLIEAQRQRGLDAQRAQLVRGGVTGGAAANQQARLNAGFNESALGRRDTALEGGLQLKQSALQNELAPPTLATAQLAANKSEQSGGGGGKGGK